VISRGDVLKHQKCNFQANTKQTKFWRQKDSQFGLHVVPDYSIISKTEMDNTRRAV
jgi:hypothetical protein